MNRLPIRSMRPFLGSKDFALSCRFYHELGFEEIELEKGFHLFQNGQFAFYLQDAWVKDWIENSQLFAEVESADAFWQFVSTLELEKKFPGVVVKSPVSRPWGKEFFVHDPSGILWHFGNFNS
jgi:catechol 2,3-dioxygenase-like lactoylglutathione lyase family enzyme